MNAILQEFKEFVETRSDDEEIDHRKFETCAIGGFYNYIGDPIGIDKNGDYHSPFSKSKNLLNILYSIPSVAEDGEDIFRDICACETYGKLKTLLNENLK